MSAYRNPPITMNTDSTDEITCVRCNSKFTFCVLHHFLHKTRVWGGSGRGTVNHCVVCGEEGSLLLTQRKDAPPAKIVHHFTYERTRVDGCELLEEIHKIIITLKADLMEDLLEAITAKMSWNSISKPTPM